ncbi:hypothetical protein TWF694_011234 [Orbilia ellipsospora]|uniref:Uncharacterized protein n=1 Tax=Orbilia ellipsospora TaxID=2528407 RepID=A0AAV9X9G1_9PEZI
MHFPHIISTITLLVATVAAVPTLTIRSTLATGDSEKQEFTTWAQDLDSARQKFINSVPMSVWDKLADLQNRVDASLDSSSPNEGLVHQISYAKGSIYECTIPDFDNLPTTLQKPKNNCPAS